MNSIKCPIFIVSEDSTVEFLHELWQVNCCNMEPIDVADGVYLAYDCEGQVLKLVTINEETGSIERPTEDVINIPFLAKIIGITNNRTIKAIPQGIKEADKLMKILVRDLFRAGYAVDGLVLPELVAIYQQKYPKLDID